MKAKKGNKKHREKNMRVLRKMSADPRMDIDKYDQDIWMQSRNYRRLAKKLEKKGVK
tara:strand:- start:49 stop:219 length:171 start_codon:yes stop_codon:yes gene_type:complete